MRVYHSIQDFSARNPIVTVGMFDGVHKGHRAILAQLSALKSTCDGESVLLTFWPHPRMYFGQTEGFRILTTLEEKLTLLDQVGLDVCLVLPFSDTFANLSPESYITDILCSGIGVKNMVIGYDHTYGKGGMGNYELMQQMGRLHSFTVERINAVNHDDVTISSTKIRNMIAKGDIASANEYLSYRYFIQGTVVSGFQIGRKIGFPTANVTVSSALKEIPGDGVYAGVVRVAGKRYPSVINIGNNPTVHTDAAVSIETHIIGFNQDIYGCPISLEFVSRLRGEETFSSKEALQNAIAHDVQTAIQMKLV